MTDDNEDILIPSFYSHHECPVSFSSILAMLAVRLAHSMSAVVVFT